MVPTPFLNIEDVFSNENLQLIHHSFMKEYYHLRLVQGILKKLSKWVTSNGTDVDIRKTELSAIEYMIENLKNSYRI